MKASYLFFFFIFQTIYLFFKSFIFCNYAPSAEFLKRYCKRPTSCANIAPSPNGPKQSKPIQTHENQPLILRILHPRRSRHPRVVSTHVDPARSALRHAPFSLVHRPLVAFAPLLSYSQSTTNHKPQTKNENPNRQHHHVPALRPIVRHVRGETTHHPQAATLNLCRR